MTTHARLALTGASLTVLLGLGTPMAFAQSKSPQAQPAAQDSGTMQRADKEDMRPVLMKLQELGAKPIEQLSVEQARSQPTPADAVKAVLKDQGKDPLALMAAMKVAKKDMTYPTAGGTQTIRIYTPEGASSPLPVIVYYHGGGWVIADIDTYESSAMALAKKANAIVASVEYRKGPENKFPAAHDDAFAAYKWVLENAGQFNGDAARVAVAGESAGGNLATSTAIMARDQKVQMPVHMLLVYPVAGTDMTTPSYQKNEKAMPLSKAGMEWFADKYLGKPEDKQSPLLNLYSKADLKGLPPATLINAEIDPLESDGKLLADNLKAAGVETARHVYAGVTHEFFGMDAVLDDAKKAQEVAVKDLREAFAKHSTTGSTTQRPKQ
ncbi:alpha/beta hydrolase [Microvirga zambiensis]|uniref:alpha/beta hydrolase n=1 Tax=Microvirga zambiensis TaxID=1402137 RepID=UPI00191D2108|nr:alpha/beta hydrolase [Microvirga zambiensis]